MGLHYSPKPVWSESSPAQLKLFPLTSLVLLIKYWLHRNSRRRVIWEEHKQMPRKKLLLHNHGAHRHGVKVSRFKKPRQKAEVVSAPPATVQHRARHRGEFWRTFWSKCSFYCGHYVKKRSLRFSSVKTFCHGHVCLDLVQCFCMRDEAHISLPARSWGFGCCLEWGGQNGSLLSG